MIETKLPESSSYQFKQFCIDQEKSCMKVGLDGILLGAWSDSDSPNKALDIGAGTGLVAIMLAQRFPKMQIDAVEVDSVTYEECQSNVKASPWAANIETHMEAIQGFDIKDNAYDLIVCNPPLYSGGTMTFNSNRETVRETTKLSHSDLLRAAKNGLTNTGNFCVILPRLEGMRFIELAASYGLHLAHQTAVSSHSGVSSERLLLSFCIAKPELIKKADLFIHDKDGKHTAEYDSLIAEFIVG